VAGESDGVFLVPTEAMSVWVREVDRYTLCRAESAMMTRLCWRDAVYLIDIIKEASGVVT